MAKKKVARIKQSQVTVWLTNLGLVTKSLVGAKKVSAAGAQVQFLSRNGSLRSVILESKIN